MAQADADSFELQAGGGLVPKKTILQAIINPPSFCAHIDGADQDRLDRQASAGRKHSAGSSNGMIRRQQSPRSMHSAGGHSILNAETQSFLATDHPDLHDKITRGTFGAYAVQAFFLTLTVFAYVAPPIVINWAKTVGYNAETEKPVKVSTFLEATVIIFAKGGVAMIGLSYAVFKDYKEKSGYKYVSMLLSWQSIKPWLLIGGGYAMADVAEIMANGRVDAATYTILSQSRLVGTAVAMRLILGTQRPAFQWSILFNLSIILLGWQMTPNVFGVAQATKASAGETLGYFSVVVKVILSITCGVVAQRQFTAGGDMPFIIMQGTSCLVGWIFCMMFTPILVYVLLPAVGDPWVDQNGVALGFFDGMPVPHGEGLANAGDATGWSSKTAIVLFCYIYREIFTTYCLMRFNALVKTMCSAIAVVFTYAIAVYVLHDMAPNVVKFIFAGVICLETVHYGLAGAPPKA